MEAADGGNTEVAFREASRAHSHFGDALNHILRMKAWALAAELGPLTSAHGDR